MKVLDGSVEWNVSLVASSAAVESVNSTLSTVDTGLQGVKTMLGTLYYARNTVKRQTGSVVEVCRLTVPKGGLYLAIGSNALSAGYAAIMNAALAIDGNYIIENRTTAHSGGGLNVVGIGRCPANGKIQLYAYGYDSSDYNFEGWIQAIRLSD